MFFDCINLYCIIFTLPLISPTTACLYVNSSRSVYARRCTNGKLPDNPDGRPLLVSLTQHVYRIQIQSPAVKTMSNNRRCSCWTTSPSYSERGAKRWLQHVNTYYAFLLSMTTTLQRGDLTVKKKTYISLHSYRDVLDSFCPKCIYLFIYTSV